MASKNYMQEAIDRGWYDPESGKPFIWQDVYAPLPVEYAISRFWLFYSQQAPSLRKWPRRSLSHPYKSYDNYHSTFEPLSIYPTTVKPEKKISVQDVMAFQRSVFKGTVYDMTSDVDWLVPDKEGNLKKSPLTTPFPTKDMRELLDINWRRNVSRGGYGMISQLRGWLPDGLGGIYWFYVDNQYTSTYVPIYGGVREISKYYSTYDPDNYSDDSARWAIDFVDNLLYLKWQEAIKDLWKVRNAMEKRFFDEQAGVDQKVAAMYQKSPNRARKYLTDLTKKRMSDVVKMYRDLRNLLISKYTNNKQGSGMNG
jgi:dipeptidase